MKAKADDMKKRIEDAKDTLIKMKNKMSEASNNLEIKGDEAAKIPYDRDLIKHKHIERPRVYQFN